MSNLELMREMGLKWWDKFENSSLKFLDEIKIIKLEF